MPRYDGGNGDADGRSTISIETETPQITSAHVTSTWPGSTEFTVRRQYSMSDPARPEGWNDFDGDGQVVWGPVEVAGDAETDLDLTAAGLQFGFDSPYYGDEYLSASGDGAVSPGGEIQLMLRPAG